MMLFVIQMTFALKGANVMLQRVMAIKQITPDEDAEFLSFDLQMECSTSTYVRARSYQVLYFDFYSIINIAR